MSSKRSFEEVDSGNFDDLEAEREGGDLSPGMFLSTVMIWGWIWTDWDAWCRFETGESALMGLVLRGTTHHARRVLV